MKFLVDNQLPVALVRFFTERGHDCRHVLDLKMDEADDGEIWQYAAVNGMAIISKDEDFVRLAVTSNLRGQLVYVRLGNCRNEILIDAFDSSLPKIFAALERGERIIELR